MNDLLGNVRGGSDDGVRAEDVEAGFAAPPTEAEMSMQAFFKYVEDIKTDVAEIRSLQKEINEMHERSKTIVKSKEMQKHREDMQVRGCSSTCMHRGAPEYSPHLYGAKQSPNVAMGDALVFEDMRIPCMRYRCKAIAWPL